MFYVQLKIKILINLKMLFTYILSQWIMQGQHFLPSRMRVSTCSYWRLEWAAWVSTWSGQTASSSTILTGIPAPTCRPVSGRGGSGRNARSRYTDSSLPAPLRRKYTTGRQDTCNFVTTHILRRKYTTGRQDTCNFVTTHMNHWGENIPQVDKTHTTLLLLTYWGENIPQVDKTHATLLLLTWTIEEKIYHR